MQILTSCPKYTYSAAMHLPFPRSYWVEPGRLLAGFYPGDSDPVEAEYKLQALLDCGVSRVFGSVAQWSDPA